MIITRQHVAKFFVAVMLLCAVNFITTFVWLIFLTDVPLLLKILAGSPMGFAWMALLGGAGLVWRAGHQGEPAMIWGMERGDS